MDHVSINEVITSIGTEYQIVREDGMVLAVTYIKHYAIIIFEAIANDIDSEDDDNLHG